MDAALSPRVETPARRWGSRAAAQSGLQRVHGCPSVPRRGEQPGRAPVLPRQHAGAASASRDDAHWASLPQVTAVLGAQWGDEGKGKLVDVLAQRYDVVARCQGGANAGHTIYDAAGKKYALHLVPSGILNPQATCVVGNGCVVHLPSLFKEIDALEQAGVKVQGRLLLSDRAHLLFDLHKEVDGLREAELAGSKIGTTKRGIGPCYASKATRNGLRVCDLADQASFATKLRALAADAAARFPSLKSNYSVDNEVTTYAGPLGLAARAAGLISDTVTYVQTAQGSGKRILVEGANATLLDVDFGTYPFVTSSNPSVGGIISGLGLAPKHFGCLVGVAKAYTTRVGSGPYPTEITDSDGGDAIRQRGAEYGTTTGRPRRCGWLDAVALRYACAINGFDSINLTKLDVLSGMAQLKVATAYTYPDGTRSTSFPASVEALEVAKCEYETLPGWQEDISKVRNYDDLPATAKSYIARVEQLVGVPVRYIGVGPGRDALLIK